MPYNVAYVRMCSVSYIPVEVVGSLIDIGGIRQPRVGGITMDMPLDSSTS